MLFSSLVATQFNHLYTGWFVMDQNNQDSPLWELKMYGIIEMT